MEEGGPKALAVPSLRAAAKQSSVPFWIATGLRPLAMTAIPPVRPRLPTFLAKGLTGRT